MDKFLQLSEEKQTRIVEAGFSCFGKYGYNKASVSDIAKEAGISKAMIFHYFGSKKGMYTYLIGQSSSILEEAARNNVSDDIGGFFDHLIHDALGELKILESHPSLLAFALSVCREEDPEVQDIIIDHIRNVMQFHGCMNFLTDQSDYLKDDVNPEQIVDLLSNYVQNKIRVEYVENREDLRSIMNEIIGVITMLKKNCCKTQNADR